MAVKTRKTYETARRNYTLHCKIHTRHQPFPATVTTLASWVAELGDTRTATKTIKSYLSGIRSYQVDIGFEDLEVFHHPMLQRIIAGVKRLRGEKDKRERKPITRNILLDILSCINQDTITGANLHAAFCLAFAAFLRCGEFTYTVKDLESSDFGSWHLTRKSVNILDDQLTISLPASKTDPFRQGITLTVAATKDKACAIASMRNLYDKYPTSPETPLFQQEKGAFTREFVTSNLRTYLYRLKYEGNYSGHSFRRGAATSAKEAGLTDNEIQLLGRWKSDAYRRYIQAHPNYILNTSKRFQLPTTS